MVAEKLGGGTIGFLMGAFTPTEGPGSDGILSGKLGGRATGPLPGAASPIEGPGSGDSVGGRLAGSAAPLATRTMSILGTLTRLGVELDGLRGFP